AFASPREASMPETIRTPVPDLSARFWNSLNDRWLHFMTRSLGSTRYGPQIAPAAIDVVSAASAAVRMRTARPASARQIPVVSPETPQPMTSASARFIAVEHGLVSKGVAE